MRQQDLVDKMSSHEGESDDMQDFVVLASSL